MLTDLRECAPDSRFEADLCIVGAGPAGIALTNEFAGTKVSVLLVEAGGLNLDPASDELNDADSIGLPHREYRRGRARVFGGAGRLWAGQCLRFDAIDFEQRDWVPFSGWPLAAADLAPYYDRAESFFRVGGESYGTKTYEKFGIEPPRWDSDALASMFTVYTPEVDVGQAWRTRIGALQNVRVLLHANLVDIRVVPSSKAVSSIDVRTLEGKQAKVTAKAFVLCAGGMENARLLLAARHQIPHGLGNETGQVGRYFQEHPNAFTAEVATADSTHLERTFRMLYGKNGLRYFPKFKLQPAVQRSKEVLNCNATLSFEYPEDSGIAALQEVFRAVRKRRIPERPMQKAWSMLRDAGEVAEAVRLRARSGQSPNGKPSRILLQCYLEQAPNPDSQLCLSDRTDSLGIPKLTIDWRVTELERRTLRVLTATIQGEFTRLGLGKVTPHDWLQQEDPDWALHLSDCAHHCGTTRMATGPTRGVVDSDCQVFGVDDLYVAGSSVFPTSSYANPNLTIVTLAIRLADRLKAKLAGS